MVQTTLLSGLRTVTTAPASALPAPPVIVTGPLVGFGLAVPVGTNGALLSKVKRSEPDGLTFPAVSVEVAESGPPVTVPLQLNEPSPAAVVVQTTLLSGFRIMTVELASALPETVTGPFVGFGEAVPVGALGAVLSKVSGRLPAGLVLPTASVAVIESGPPFAVPLHE